MTHRMALAPCTRLGPCEIQSPLGAGGMGEVYRARDSRLERIVAIKVLPSSFAGDADRLQQFERGEFALSLSTQVRKYTNV
jgi:serine/threonine protein kinase